MPSVNKMVEQVARSAGADADDRDFDLLRPETQNRMRLRARLAIAAMREPTEAMQIAGHNKRVDPVTGLPTHCGTDEIYSAMIDAALEEPQ